MATTTWTTPPDRVAGTWHGYRQCDPSFPPLYHHAPSAHPDQASGRWHRLSEGYAQYLALSASGAWAECARVMEVRSTALAKEVRRRLWQVYVDESDIADLSTFERYERCGLDPAIAVSSHGHSQPLADALRSAGYRGVLSPSAALEGVTNLTLFGMRFEKVLMTGLDQWENPAPGRLLPVELLAADSGVPERLCTETVFTGKPHEGLERWRHRRRS